MSPLFRRKPSEEEREAAEQDTVETAAAPDPDALVDDVPPPPDAEAVVDDVPPPPDAQEVVDDVPPPPEPEPEPEPVAVEAAADEDELAATEPSG